MRDRIEDFGQISTNLALDINSSHHQIKVFACYGEATFGSFMLTMEEIKVISFK